MKERITKRIKEVKEIGLPYEIKLGEITRETLIEMLAEYVRGYVEKTLTWAIERELTGFLGYKPYERGKKKNNYRNGSYKRSLLTRLGEVSLNIARDRNGEFESGVIRRYKRRGEEIDRDIIALFIGGISTRKMKGITRRLWGKGYSASSVSRINKELTEAMREWMKAPIEEEIVYMFIDGLNLPVRRFTVSKESLLMVIGITKDGVRKILGVQLGDRESASSWREFFKDLKARGLDPSGLQLGIMDGLAGLERAFEEEFPQARIQRCIVHKMWNIGAKLPRSIQKDCLAQCKRLFYSASLEEAQKRFEVWKENWGKTAPSAVECLEKDIQAVFTYYLFPKSHWVKIRTTNIIERAFKEFRRRTRQMDSFPNEECCLRCIYAISEELNDRWSRKKSMRFPMMTKEEKIGQPLAA